MNTDRWNKLSEPPEWALRPISGGRLTGKTDINPQWRYLAMTETYGECGIGWKYAIEKQWNEAGANDEIFVFVQISLYIKDGDRWSDPIPGSGGAMLVGKEKSGLHNNDDAFKMATTDALSVAMKMLGVGAKIYMNLWDGKRFKSVDEKTSKPDPQKQTSPNQSKQAMRLPEIAEEMQLSYDSFKNGLRLLEMRAPQDPERTLSELTEFWINAKPTILKLPDNWIKDLTAKKDQIKTIFNNMLRMPKREIIQNEVNSLLETIKRAKMKTVLQGAEEDALEMSNEGKITQEEYDQIIQEIANKSKELEK